MRSKNSTKNSQQLQNSILKRYLFTCNTIIMKLFRSFTILDSQSKNQKFQMKDLDTFINKHSKFYRLMVGQVIIACTFITILVIIEDNGFLLNHQLKGPVFLLVIQFPIFFIPNILNIFVKKFEKRFSQKNIYQIVQLTFLVLKLILLPFQIEITLIKRNYTFPETQEFGFYEIQLFIFFLMLHLHFFGNQTMNLIFIIGIQAFMFIHLLNSMKERRWTNICQMIIQSLLAVGTYYCISSFQELEKQQLYNEFKNNKRLQKNWKNVVDELPESIIIFNYKQDIIFYNKTAEQLFSSLTYSDCYQKINYNMICQKFNNLKILPNSKNQNKQQLIRQIALNSLEEINLIDLCNNVKNCFTLQEILTCNNIFIQEINNESEIFLSEAGSLEKHKVEKQILQIQIKQLKFQKEDCFLLTAKDITETVKQQSEADLNVYKTKVLSSFSHELRTPLNGAISPLQIALSNPLIPEESKNSLENSYLSLCILENTLNDIVDLSLILSNQFQLIVTNVNIMELVAEVIQIAEKQAYFKQIEIKTEIDKNIPSEFKSDKKRLKQILLNLMSNALKFTNNGSITLRIKNNPEQYNELIFQIQDTGIGISPEKLTKLQKFLKHPNYNKMKEFNEINPTSCCLGLLISQNIALAIVQNEGKGLIVESELGQGTKFSFGVIIERIKSESQILSSSYVSILNLNESFEEYHNNSLVINKKIVLFENKPCKTRQQNIPGGIFSIQKKKEKEIIENVNQIEDLILVVDDDCFNLLAMELNLNKLNKKCIKAFNGQEAVNILMDIYVNKTYHMKNIQISLILMDYQMPILNGIEATQQIQKLIKDNLLPNIPIVACTAYGAKQQIDQCIEAGMVDYLIKPISQPTLIEFFKKLNQF